jgi:hypothetical protein
MREQTNSGKMPPFRFTEAIVRTHLPLRYATPIEPGASLLAARFLYFCHVHTWLDLRIQLHHFLRKIPADCVFPISDRNLEFMFQSQGQPKLGFPVVLPVKSPSSLLLSLDFWRGSRFSPKIVEFAI